MFAMLGIHHIRRVMIFRHNQLFPPVLMAAVAL
jgi:hypothetical protein